jgi:hypothetical protein
MADDLLGSYRPTGIQLIAEGSAENAFAVQLDALLRELPSFRSSVTRYPIEAGADKADHIRLEPVELEIEGLITNTPSIPVDGQNSAELEQSNPNQTVIAPQHWNVSLSRPATNQDFCAEAYLALKQIRDGREIVTVVSNLDVFQNMALTLLECPRGPETGLSLPFRAHFTQMQSAQFISLPVAAASVSDLAAPEQNMGFQNTVNLA